MILQSSRTTARLCSAEHPCTAEPVRCRDQSQISFMTSLLQFFFLPSTFFFPIIRVLTPFSSIFRLKIKQARHLLWYFFNHFNDLIISRGEEEEGNESNDKAKKSHYFFNSGTVGSACSSLFFFFFNVEESVMIIVADARWQNI